MVGRICRKERFSAWHGGESIEPMGEVPVILIHILLHPFNGLFSRTTRVSQYQKGKTSLDLNEARVMGFLDAVASAGPYANNLHLMPHR